MCLFAEEPLQLSRLRAEVGCEPSTISSRNPTLVGFTRLRRA